MAITLGELRHSGWLHALFIAVVAHPLGNLAARVGHVNFSADPIAYTAVTLLAASLCLMLIARPGPLGNDTLRRPETWIYGVLNTLVYALGVGAVAYVSATEISLLMRVSTILVFVLSWMFLGQPISRQEWLGNALIGIGVVTLLAYAGLDLTSLVVLTTMLLLRGVAQAVQQIVVEKHKTNRIAETLGQNLRVTAVVMGVTSAIFILVFMTLAYVKSFTTEPLWPSLPDFDDFTNLGMYLLALFIGAAVLAPSKYCEFYSAKKISAKYLLAVVSMQPIFTAAYEIILDTVGVTPMQPLSVMGWFAMAAVMLGSVVLALSGLRLGNRVSPDAQSFILDPASNESVRHTVALTMTFAKGNKLKTAQLLGLELKTLKDILADKKGELQFTRELARRVQRHFADHVAMADPLTGLQNRLQFMTALTQKLKGKAPVNLVLIDLNKFKPVNDTYGHAAGDLVLQLVAKRLKQSAPKNAVVARLGGDEFALFTTAAINTKALLAKLAVPYRTKYGSLTVTASLGMAQSGKDGKTPEALLAAADKRMYGQKR